MDHLSETQTHNKRRRHSATFKAQVLEEIAQPGTSIASVAQRYGINANLVHKWRRTHLPPATCSAFIALQQVPTPAAKPVDSILIELPVNATTLKIHWPVAHAAGLVQWLKALSV